MYRGGLNANVQSCLAGKKMWTHRTNPKSEAVGTGGVETDDEMGGPGTRRAAKKEGGQKKGRKKGEKAGGGGH